MPQLLYQFITLITKETPTEAEFSKYILSLRYHHRAEISTLISFSALILSCNNLNTQREVFYNNIEEILKRLLLQADFVFILLTYCKLLPLLNWVNGRSQREVNQVLGSAFKDLTKPLVISKGSKPSVNEEAQRCLNQHLSLLKLLDSKHFFLFFFQLINGASQSLENNIDFYFLQLQNSNIEQQGLISSSELAIIQKNFYLEYAKLRRRRYQEEIIPVVYKWLEFQLEVMLYEGENPANHLLIEILTQTIRSQSSVCGATLLQVLDTSLESIPPGKNRYFLELIDTCLIEGAYKISTQAIIFLISSIFTKIHSRKLKVPLDVILEHFLLWRQIALKRRLPAKLITCLTEWLPFLYGLSSIGSKEDPQILQLYRKQLLRIENEEELSEISGLRVVVQELQFRKIQAIYEQMQEFHMQMESDSREVYKLSKELKSNKLNFTYKISGVSKNNSDINSLLNGLQSQASQGNAKSRNMQLQILSKPHSMSGSGMFSMNSSRSIGECVQIIMSLIELFDYHVKQPSTFTEEQENLSLNNGTLQNLNLSYQSSLLPVMSTYKNLPAQHVKTREQGKNKLIMQQLKQLRDVTINYLPQTEQTKKRMAKHRGLIIKSQPIEIGYLFQTKESRISFFVTFLRPLAKFTLHIRGNSFKFKKPRSTEISEPKTNKQYKFTFEVESIKFYQLQGVSSSERLIRSKIEARLQQTSKMEEQVYDVPMSVFNFIEWMAVEPEDESYFELAPALETKWQPACPKFIKHGEQYLKKYCAFKRDGKGNYLLKGRLNSNIILGKLILVLTEVKIQIMNSNSALLPMAILEVVG